MEICRLAWALVPSFQKRQLALRRPLPPGVPEWLVWGIGCANITGIPYLIAILLPSRILKEAAKQETDRLEPTPIPSPNRCETQPLLRPYSRRGGILRGIRFHDPWLTLHHPPRKRGSAEMRCQGGNRRPRHWHVEGKRPGFFCARTACACPRQVKAAPCSLAVEGDP